MMKLDKTMKHREMHRIPKVIHLCRRWIYKCRERMDAQKRPSFLLPINPWEYSLFLGQTTN